MLRWTLVLTALLGVTWVLGGLPRVWGSVPSASLPEENEVLAKMARLLGRDMIPPVYAPRAVVAAQARLRDDELVLGVEINGEAKAYPITVLNAREMVNDTVGRVPILATW
jgi:hypothetical protein